MAGLSDSLTIGILLLLVFGAAAFYLYSRMTQNEKRLGLLENLLLTLKMTTEASLMGPDSVEAVSQPGPLHADDVDEQDYAAMLQETQMPSASSSSAQQQQQEQEQEQEQKQTRTEDAEAEEAKAEELLRSLAVPERKMDANYESMSAKELQTLAKERGITGLPMKKRELVDALKKQGGSVPVAPKPLVPSPEDVLSPFQVDLEQLN
jgi:hypothetical protein